MFTYLVGNRNHPHQLDQNGWKDALRRDRDICNHYHNNNNYNNYQYYYNNNYYYYYNHSNNRAMPPCLG